MTSLILSKEVAQGIRSVAPVVALESTVITHGLPHPQNLELAREMEAAVRVEGGIPATVAVLDGELRLGLSEAELERLAQPGALKISRRDFAAAMLRKASGGTTVAASLHAAHQAGIRVFATGGIGGVHRGERHDISADLQALVEIAMVVVCAGAKAILDLPATLEYLETMSVPVVGYGTEEFPAFYSRGSGLKVSARLDSPAEVAGLARHHWDAGLHSAVLVANPIPEADAIPGSEIEPVIERAAVEARHAGVRGPALTPYLLGRIGELTRERSVRANLSLLLNNARLAAQIAVALTAGARIKTV